MITEKEYDNLIDVLQKAKIQLSPDGNCCIVCGDNDHQAWECNHNPAVLYNKYWNTDNPTTEI